MIHWLCLLMDKEEQMDFFAISSISKIVCKIANFSFQHHIEKKSNKENHNKTVNSCKNYKKVQIGEKILSCFAHTTSDFKLQYDYAYSWTKC